MTASDLCPGDPAPRCVAASPTNAEFHFNTVAGRHVVLCFFGSAGSPGVRAMLDQLVQRTDLFDDRRASFCCVSNDPDDLAFGRVTQRLPGIRYFWHFDREIARAYGIGASARALPMSFVLDPALRLLARIDPAEPERHAAKIADLLGHLPPLGEQLPAVSSAPVLTVPNVFETGFCRDLVAHYERVGGKEGGFMVTDPSTGRTVMKHDPMHKRRRDCTIGDADVREAIRTRIARRLVPEIRHAFQFSVTRVERYLIACFDAAEGGHFRPHRDNTTKATAHRRFAVTINVNAREYADAGGSAVLVPAIPE